MECQSCQLLASTRLHPDASLGEKSNFRRVRCQADSIIEPFDLNSPAYVFVASAAITKENNKKFKLRRGSYDSSAESSYKSLEANAVQFVYFLQLFSVDRFA